MNQYFSALWGWICLYHQNSNTSGYLKSWATPDICGWILWADPFLYGYKLSRYSVWKIAISLQKSYLWNPQHPFHISDRIVPRHFRTFYPSFPGKESLFLMAFSYFFLITWTDYLGLTILLIFSMVSFTICLIFKGSDSWYVDIPPIVMFLSK